MKSQSIIIILIFSLLTFFGCQKESLTPIASFTVDKSLVEIGETVSFTNSSENSIDYIWDFGDGSASADLNPTHAYQKVGTYTVELTAYDERGNKDISTTTVEIIPPPSNIEPGIRAGDFYLNDDLNTHFAKLDTSQMEYNYITKTNDEHLHVFTFHYAGIVFYLTTPTDNYDINDIPNQIEVYPPFDGWAMGGITFGSSFEEVADVFGEHPTTSGDHFYDGIIFWADNLGQSVSRITVR